MCSTLYVPGGSSRTEPELVQLDPDCFNDRRFHSAFGALYHSEGLFDRNGCLLDSLETAHIMSFFRKALHYRVFPKEDQRQFVVMTRQTLADFVVAR